MTTCHAYTIIETDAAKAKRNGIPRESCPYGEDKPNERAAWLRG